MCGKQFYAEQNEIKSGRQYCSRKCVGIANGNRMRGKPAPWNGKPVELRICVICDETFKFYDSHSNRNLGKCCGRKCADKWHSIRMGGTGEPETLYPPEFNRVKEKIRARDDWKCRHCGVPQEEMLRKLSIHHIDGDKSNNLPDNLITLCQSCHIRQHVKNTREIKYA